MVSECCLAALMAIHGQSKLHYQVLQNLAWEGFQNLAAHRTEAPATFVGGYINHAALPTNS